MATLVITIGNDDCVNEGINIICNQCRPIYMNEDNKIIVNVVGEEKFGAGHNAEYITKQVDKHLGIIRDYIIEGLTDCYVEYDENGKEIFIPKTWWCICNRLLLNILQVISQKYGLNL